MKKFVILAAAAAILTPAMISAASAENASVNVRIGSPGYHARAEERVVIRKHRPHCRMVVTHIKRDGVRITKKERKCN